MCVFLSVRLCVCVSVCLCVCVSVYQDLSTQRSKCLTARHRTNYCVVGHTCLPVSIACKQTNNEVATKWAIRSSNERADFAKLVDLVERVFSHLERGGVGGGGGRVAQTCTSSFLFFGWPQLRSGTVVQWSQWESCTEWDSCIHVHHFLFPGFHGRAPLSNPHHQRLHIFHAFTRSWFWEQKLNKLSWTFKLDLTENSQSNVQFCNILKKCGDVIIQFWETQDPEAITCQLVVNGGIRWQRREPSRSTTSSSSSSSTTSSSTSSSPCDHRHWFPISCLSMHCNGRIKRWRRKLRLLWNGNEGSTKVML